MRRGIQPPLALLALVAALQILGCGHNKSKEQNTSLGLDAESSPGDIYVAMAAEYYRLGQLDAAVRRGEQAIGEDKSNPRAYYVMALIYQRIGQIPMADENFKKALELSPNNPDVLNAYGGFHCSQGRYAEADTQFAKALGNPLYSSPWVAMTNAGICAASAGNLTKAEGEYKRALNANPRYGPALFRMAEMAYSRGDAKGAKAYMDRYFQANVPSPSALALALKAERKLGNSKTAATYEQVLRKNFPSSPETLEL